MGDPDWQGGKAALLCTGARSHNMLGMLAVGGADLYRVHSVATFAGGRFLCAKPLLTGFRWGKMPLYSDSPLDLQGCLPGADAETEFTYIICGGGLPTLPAGSAPCCRPVAPEGAMKKAKSLYHGWSSLPRRCISCVVKS